MFEGISQFRLTDDGLIAHYGEAFDRGVALVQLGFPAERIRRIVEKAAAAQNAHPGGARPSRPVFEVTIRSADHRPARTRSTIACAAPR